MGEYFSANECAQAHRHTQTHMQAHALVQYANLYAICMPVSATPIFT